jgi:hypothetical protein
MICRRFQLRSDDDATFTDDEQCEVTTQGDVLESFDQPFSDAAPLLGLSCLG